MLHTPYLILFYSIKFYQKCGKRATAFRHVGALPPAGGNIHLTLLIGYRRIAA